MRLWHYKLIPFLPNKQLISQWRELNLIFTNKPDHILINYVYDYPKTDLYLYTLMIVYEMRKRNISIKTFSNIYHYFEIDYLDKVKSESFLYQSHPFEEHHDGAYYKICCANLYEKLIRGQTGFTIETTRLLKQVMDD